VICCTRIAPKPAQLSGGALTGKQSKTVGIAVSIHHATVLVVRIAVRALLALGKRSNFKILGLHAPAPAPVRVFEVVGADKHCVLARLVVGKVCDEPTIAECGGIAVKHEHTASVAFERKQLASAAIGVDIVGKRSACKDLLSSTRDQRGALRRLSMGTATRN
jgi:hypothetical protein